MRPRRTFQRAFSLAELIIASVLTSLMAMVLLWTWDTFGRTALLVSRRVQLAQEAELTLARLGADLNGYRSEDLDGASTNSLVGVRMGYLKSVRSSDGKALTLAFQGRPPAPAELTVTYRIVSDGVAPPALVRSVGGSTPDEVIAQHVVTVVAVQRQVPTQSGPGLYAITLTFGMPILEDRNAGRGLQRSYTLLAVVPAPAD